MKKIAITDDIQITEITMGNGSIDNPETIRIMDAYLEAGGNSFDSARLYADGKYDTFLGKWIRDRGIRDNIVITMKGCFPQGRGKLLYNSRLSKSEIKGDLEVTLKETGLDHTDMYLLHRDDPTLPVEGIMVALDELVKEGKTRTIGVSNWTVSRLIMANEFAKKNGLARLCVSQIFFSLAYSTPASSADLTRICMCNVEYDWYQAADFPVMTYSSQAKGFFSKVEKGEELRDKKCEVYSCFPENYLRAKRAVELGKRYGVSATTIALAYLLADPLRTSSLVKFSSFAQYQDSMQALKINMTAEEHHWLETGKHFF